MLRSLILAALLAAGPAVAGDLVANQGADSVRLTDRPCANPLVLVHIAAEQQEGFRAARAMFQGKDYAACWRIMGNVAHLVYEDADQGFVSLGLLKPAPEGI